MDCAYVNEFIGAYWAKNIRWHEIHEPVNAPTCQEFKFRVLAYATLHNEQTFAHNEQAIA